MSIKYTTKYTGIPVCGPVQQMVGVPDKSSYADTSLYQVTPVALTSMTTAPIAAAASGAKCTHVAGQRQRPLHRGDIQITDW